jgi:short-subunit dehydrogenase
MTFTNKTFVITGASAGIGQALAIKLAQRGGNLVLAARDPAALKTTAYCTHYALPYLKESQGLLVAISSLSGKTGIPTRSAYVASKHAMQGFFDTLRIELRGTGVDVLVVSPGFVATDIRQHILGADGHLQATSLQNEQQEAMSVEECVGQIVQAMAQRRRELVMTPKGRFGLWLKLIAPKLLDRIAASAVRSQEPR